MKVKNESEVAQSCPTLSDPMDYSPPGSSVYGILQARLLEWVAMSSSRDLSDPEIEPESSVIPALQVDSLPLNQGEKLLLKILFNKNESVV